jgi:uncharacterized protein YndB with AHSA1/START domain
MTDDQANALLPGRPGMVVHLEREYVATPEEAWSVWTDPKRLSRWLGAASASILTPGGVRLAMDPDDADQWVDVETIESQPPTLLRLRWEFAGGEGSMLTVRIDPVGETRVRMTLDHEGLGDSTVGYGAGWQAYLDGGGLAREFGGTSGRDWDAVFSVVLPQWKERARSAVER